jgi:hypothetical protein
MTLDTTSRFLYDCRMKSYEVLDQFRTAASSDKSATCSTQVMRAFGVSDAREYCRSGNQLQRELKAAGFKVRRLWVSSAMRSVPTLKAFMDKHPQGEYVMVSLTGPTVHSMALRDGALTDSDMMGTSRRRINVAYQVTR